MQIKIDVIEVYLCFVAEKYFFVLQLSTDTVEQYQRNVRLHWMKAAASSPIFSFITYVSPGEG